MRIVGSGLRRALLAARLLLAKPDLADGMVAVGLVTLGVGIALVSPAAALITVGAILLALGLAGSV